MTTGRAAQEAADAEGQSEQAGLIGAAGLNSSSDSPGTNGERHEGDVESQQLVASKVEEIPKLSRNDPAVGFLEAWKIPGVATFAFCLFFSKLVAYTFLYWLPFYIRQTRKLQFISNLSPSYRHIRKPFRCSQFKTFFSSSSSLPMKTNSFLLLSENCVTHTLHIAPHLPAQF